MNQELLNIQTWFNVNKLSLNITKTKYSFVHSLAYQDLIPLRLPSLIINSISIRREITMNCLEILLDENIIRRNHIASIESKVSKNLGILYKARILI